MAFEHETFWLAVAAALPIIALANQINLTDALGTMLFARVARDSPIGTEVQYVRKRSRSAALTSYFVGGANLLAQTAALGIALISLAIREDAFPGAVPFATTLEIVGLIAIGTTAAFSGYYRGWRSALETSLRQQEQKSGRTDSDPGQPSRKL